jgi:serine/threonine protein kinase
LPESSIRQFAIDILRGLSYSHCQGVIYSDLKPANVLIAENGQLKLSNFGQAQRVKDISEQPAGRSAHDGAQSSKPPSLVRARGGPRFDATFVPLGGIAAKNKRGTPCYMAPELFQVPSPAQHYLMRQLCTCACSRVGCRILATVSATGRRRLQFCIGSVGIRLRPLRDGRRYAQRCDKPCSTPIGERLCRAAPTAHAP